jgi:hypothetical protein
MDRRTIALVFAVAAFAVAGGASAQTPPKPKAEVLAKWPKFAADSAYSYYREPAVARKGSSAIVWKMAEPTPSMASIGVPTLYSRLEFDCTAKRRKILALVRLNADGSVKPPPAQDVALDKWFDILDAADYALFLDICRQS